MANKIISITIEKKMCTSLLISMTPECLSGRRGLCNGNFNCWGKISSVQFSFIYFTLGYSIYIVYVTNRNKITNKKRKRKKLMVLVEVSSGQRSLISFRADCTATL